MLMLCWRSGMSKLDLGNLVPNDWPSHTSRTQSFANKNLFYVELEGEFNEIIKYYNITSSRSLGHENKLWAVLVKMTYQPSHKYRTNIKYTAWWAEHVERIKHCFTKYLACKITPANFLQSWKRLLFILPCWIFHDLH